MRLSLTQLHTADEAFSTGTMGEITPVLEVDGRKIGDGMGTVTKRVQQLFRELTEIEGEEIS